MMDHLSFRGTHTPVSGHVLAVLVKVVVAFRQTDGLVGPKDFLCETTGFSPRYQGKHLFLSFIAFSRQGEGRKG